MKKRILSILVLVCMLVCFVWAPTVSGEDSGIVTIDVGGENVENEQYKIDDTRIILRLKDQKYELTGTTDKQVQVWGSNNSEDIDKAFYITLNNVTIGGGIMVQNSPVKFVIDVPEGTVNNVASVIANDITVSGAGKLNATAFGVQQKTSYMPSRLHVTDTEITVNVEKNRSGEFNGVCLLDGNAKVTYIGGGAYAVLQVGVKNGDNTHSLTLADNAKLYCLQPAGAETTAYAVDGLELFNGATVTLKDNSYIEAEGADSTSEYVGYAIATEFDITVQDNAKIKATAYGPAIGWGNLTVNGGSIEAVSHKSNAIYTAGNINITNGATVSLKGYWPALYAEGNVVIDGSSVEAVSEADVGIYSGTGNITVTNSYVKASSGDNTHSIYAGEGNTAVTGSWVECTDAGAIDSVANSVVINGSEGTVYGEAVTPADVTIGEGVNFDIPEGTKLTVAEGTTLTNNGVVAVKGTVEVLGTLVCNNHNGGTATCTEKAECTLCGSEYGETDIQNHTGEEKWEQTETKHTKKWDCCGTVTVEEADHAFENGVCTVCQYACGHKGGTATCTEKAVCEICGEAYGELNPQNHTGEEKWEQTETKHTKKWDCCGTVTVEEADHAFENGVCTVCQYACGHKGGTATCTEKAVCEICGEAYGELNPQNHTGEEKWEQTETKHTKKWDCCGTVTVEEADHAFENGVCTVCQYACGHKGGTATCTEKAVCEICGEAYGELDVNNHKELTHVEAKEATKEEEGNTEYWYCKDCGKYYSDKDGEKEIAKADTVIPKVPQTGDESSNMLLFALLFLSAGALAAVVLTAKKKDRVK